MQQRILSRRRKRIQEELTVNESSCNYHEDSPSADKKKKIQVKRFIFKHKMKRV